MAGLYVSRMDTAAPDIRDHSDRLIKPDWRLDRPDVESYRCFHCVTGVDRNFSNATPSPPIRSGPVRLYSAVNTSSPGCASDATPLFTSTAVSV